MTDTNGQILALPILEKDKGGRPPLAEFSVLDALSPEDMVQKLEAQYGDIDLFFRSMGYQSSQFQKVLTRVYFVLHQPGNEDCLVKWEQLMRCFKKAKMAIAEHKGIKILEDIKPPDATKASLKDQLAYANFWLTDVKEEQKIKGRNVPKAIGRDATTVGVEEMLRRLDEHRSQD